MADLREFQTAAVERIVKRLTDKSGSRRFLLADEVGLGKTMVAKGVIQALHARREKHGFTIVYICSNNEIAEQNRDKLYDGKDSSVPGRLTLMALQSRQIEKQRENGFVQVFAFTPGTSLQIEHGTGIAKERRLLLYLIFRIWGKRVNRRAWRLFFRGSSEQEKWLERTQFRHLKAEFSGHVAGDLQNRLKAQWGSQEYLLFDPDTRQEKPGRVHLRDCVDEAVEEFKKDSDNIYHKRNCNRIIGELRKGLARVALEFLSPDLIILDEFQRFSDILIESKNEQSIVGKLFAKGSGAILILSATPYKMYTLAHETENHHEDFLKTLAFLRNELPESKDLKEIREDLRQFRERLALGEWAANDDLILSEIRGRIENRLKEVMCRTERNWYLEDAAKGVREVTIEGVLPEKTELVEYVHLRHFLLDRKVGDWNITDFWKSSPSVLSFMDRQYGLTKRIHQDRLALPPTVLRPAKELGERAIENAKFRMLFGKVFGDGQATSGGKWKYLWVRPTYTYYEDRFYGSTDPKKFLIFSHWRFVPKAISVLTSQEASKQIGRNRRKLQSAPLHFRERLAFYPFDACYPSPVLADCIDQLTIRARFETAPTEKQVFAAARLEIQKLLEDSGVKIGRTRTAPLWKIVARVEAQSCYQGEVRAGFSQAVQWKSKETSEYLPAHARQYLKWMDDSSPLSISKIWLTRLTAIALYSPAVSLLRAFRSVMPPSSETAWPDVLDFCLGGALRHYFNKRMVQIIIRRHGTGQSYTEKILSYCQRAHFQAVLDEYAYLVSNVLQQREADKFLAHIGRAMGMWSGSPGVNERTPAGHLSRRPEPQPTHFALAFGDEVSSETKELEGKGRKSAVREAFNSPFWPFVLATTSVGQEGLDFHLYCKDIVHWNLPSNPVDLEQREGRINRFDGLSIRRNISSDLALDSGYPEKGENLWKQVFLALTKKSHGNGRFKHGLFPHWIYQSQVGDGSEQSILNRHLLFYSASSDRQHYAELKNALALYRLVFGQPRQQDILERIFAQKSTQDPQELNRLLSRYMINLSPFGPEHAYRRAKQEAQRLLLDSEGMQNLLKGMPKHMERVPASVVSEIGKEVVDLIAVANGDGELQDEALRLHALEAILYLLDPYDAVHDRHGEMGYADDIRVIREAHAKACVRTS